MEEEEEKERGKGGRTHNKLLAKEMSLPTCLKCCECLVCVWKAFGNYLENVWRVSGCCLEGVLRVFGGYT